MVAHLSALCRFLRDHLTCPLLLENMDYMGTELKPGYGVFRTSVEPALMWALVEEEGVGVLLDLAHLRITAHHLGVDTRAFARSLPLHAVRELHVSHLCRGVGATRRPSGDDRGRLRAPRVGAPTHKRRGADARVPESANREAALRRAGGGVGASAQQA